MDVIIAISTLLFFSMMIGTTVEANAQTYHHLIFKSPHTLVLKTSLSYDQILARSNSTKTTIWNDVDTAKAEGYKITSVNENAYTDGGSISEDVLVVMEK